MLTVLQSSTGSHFHLWIIVVNLIARTAVKKMPRHREISPLILIFLALIISVLTNNILRKNDSARIMAAISMATTIISSRIQPPTPGAYLKPLPVRKSKAVIVSSAKKNSAKHQIEASLKEKSVASVTSAALMAAMVVPEVASAADSFSPSLKNFLLSIGAGGFVLFAIIGAVIGVSNFDPVKRG